MPSEKIDSLADDVRPLLLELLRPDQRPHGACELLPRSEVLLVGIAELKPEHGEPPKTPDKIFAATVDVADLTRVKKPVKTPGAARALSEHPHLRRARTCGAALESAGQKLARVRNQSICRRSR